MKKHVILMAFTLMAATLASCAMPQPAPPMNAEQPADQPADQPEVTPEETLDQAALDACTTYYGDPSYLSPVSNAIKLKLASQATLAQNSPDYVAQTNDELAVIFGDTKDQVREAAKALGEWFQENSSNPAADIQEAKTLIDSLALACAPYSVAAAWESSVNNEAGTKPAALVCQEIVNEPQIFKVSANGDVLASNLVIQAGLGPAWMNAAKHDLYQQLYDQLEEMKVAVDDEAVRSSIAELQEPFSNALAGNYESSGVANKLNTLSDNCQAAGFGGAIEIDPAAESSDELR